MTLEQLVTRGLFLGQVKTRTLAKPRDLKGGQTNGPGCALDGSPLPNVVEYIKEGKVDLVINIPEVRPLPLLMK